MLASSSYHKSNEEHTYLQQRIYHKVAKCPNKPEINEEDYERWN